MADLSRDEDAFEPTLSSLFEQERASRSRLWAPILVVLLSFAATGIALLIDALSRPGPVPEYASAEVIEARYAPQIAKLRELAAAHLEQHGFGSQFFSAYDDLAADGVVQAAIHPAPDETTVFGKSSLHYESHQTPPRPDAQVGRPIVYIPKGSTNVIYRGKIENDDGEGVWYSLVLDLERLRALAQADKATAPAQDEEGR